ncbi:Txe/YoeB family addiction module toxin [Candidatus Parabeggiatoa sp. HSG14]|uniref:Txe/YoeB family addiction module toxin n=1 Tax=Candidatus Parabeggiatoa sp. HSG14 TaxID=3055593 RepID=UPI0025A692BC|nr:Txe/YoeB family addiction module toxin [Thiotrichales bacterium HSG14]
MRKLRIMSTAKIDIEHWIDTDDKKYEKLKRLTEQLRLTPKTGIGKPEALKHQLSGLGSRRIDQENRLIYSFDDEYVYLWQARFHYVNVPNTETRNETIANLESDVDKKPEQQAKNE